MGETTVADAGLAPKSKPTIMVPPRGSMEHVFTNGSGPGFSPGPMTLVSSFFSEQGPFSFSQLLAGAMASPMVAKQGFSQITNDSESGKEGKEEGVSTGDAKSSGYKRNRPNSLVVAQPPEPPSQHQLESLSPLFMFPSGLSPSGLLSPGFFSSLPSPFGMSHQQALAHVTAQAALSQSFMQMQAELQCPLSTITTELVEIHSSSAPTEPSTQQANPLPTEPENLKIETFENSQPERKAAYTAGDKPASDGYNWRKYGQKNVKASECPRSYYKCTYLNCPVKKKVERSFDGRISEITYKGQHNHDPPQSNKRGKDSSALDKSLVKPVFSSERQTEPIKINESVPIHSEPASFQATSRPPLEQHPVPAGNDELRNTAVVVDDGDNDEPASQRRNVVIGSSIPASSQLTVTDSKIIVQTRSEVDLLDDGYKWRKYGQKVVKGNPHPRSYYRCTYTGCNVRKHVERSSSDPKAVITTYEGKHNHDIPAGRYSNNLGAAGASVQQLSAQNIVPNNPSSSTGMEFTNKDQSPTTLQLKER